MIAMKLPTVLLAALGAWLALATSLAAQTLRPVFAIRDGDLHGLIDRNGRVIVPPEYEELKTGNPLIMVRKASRVATSTTAGRW
jgi:hypothetical protein